MNLILCGLPGCGKTFYGKRVAETLNCDFFDLDVCIEKEGSGLTCREIFMKEGQHAFRERETKALISLKNCQKSVIALGGGSLIKEINHGLVLEMGILIYLKTPLERLLERLKTKQKTPAYIDSKAIEVSFESISLKRIEAYEKQATFILETGMLSEEDILQQLIQIFNDSIKTVHFRS